MLRQTNIYLKNRKVFLAAYQSALKNQRLGLHNFKKRSGDKVLTYRGILGNFKFNQSKKQ